MTENRFIDHKTVSLLSESERKSILEYLRFSGINIPPGVENSFVKNYRYNFFLIGNKMYGYSYLTVSESGHMSLEELKLLSRYFHG